MIETRMLSKPNVAARQFDIMVSHSEKKVQS
jgi:hypothetical protein